MAENTGISGIEGDLKSRTEGALNAVLTNTVASGAARSETFGRVHEQQQGAAVNASGIETGLATARAQVEAAGLQKILENARRATSPEQTQGKFADQVYQQRQEQERNRNGAEGRNSPQSGWTR